MKCIRCGRDSKYPERSNRTCPGCKGTFAFEPRQGDPVTDNLFQNAIKAVSGDGRLRWGVEHLYYEVNRRKRSMMTPVGCFYVLAAIAAFLLAFSLVSRHRAAFAGAGVAALLLMALLAWARRRSHFLKFDQPTFNRLWDRWRSVHGTPAGLIERAPEPPALELEPDIGDYSFDRAVICDRARTVDLLVANNFHFENNCAILAVGGYPKGPFEVVRAMIKRNPRLLVFTLHDASFVGCTLAQRLITEPEWFGGTGLRVIDLGLRPRHAGPFRGLLQEGGQLIEPGDGITPDEANWLTRYRLELAAVRPEQVLKRLFAGLNAHANDDPHSGDSAGSVTYCGAFDAGGGGGDAVVGGDAGDGGDGGGGDGGAGDAFG